MERLRDHWISLAIAAMAKIEWLSFEEWLCKHVETDKHEVYRQGWEYFQNTNKIPMVMGWFAKPVEFQFKDNLDMKCRSI